MWGTDTLTAMRAGVGAKNAVLDVVDADSGRSHRQLAALDPTGEVFAYTGADSIAFAGSRAGPSVIVAGNLLETSRVIDACFEGFQAAGESLGERLLAALDAAAKAGGDSRGLLSAALLVVNRKLPPLTLRIDKSATPLSDLRALYADVTSGAYADWAALVPTLDDPERAEPYLEKADQPV